LEAFSRGIVAHGMQGFDYEKARIDLGIPDDFEVMSMIAIGKRGPKENLPPELQDKEKLNDRKPLRKLLWKEFIIGKLIKFDCFPVFSDPFW
jgi:hypothetical protein